MNYIILGGSADFDNYDLLEKTLDPYTKELNEKFTFILSDQRSGQETGIGIQGAAYCQKHNIPVMNFPTPSKLKTGIILRNTKIAKFIVSEQKENKGIIAAFIFIHDDHELDTDGRTLATALGTRGYLECLHFIPIKTLAPDAYTGPHHIETHRENAKGIEGGSKEDRDKKGQQ